MAEETLLEIGTRLYKEGEEQFLKWFATLSLEEQKELWIQNLEDALRILDEMAGGN